MNEEKIPTIERLLVSKTPLLIHRDLSWIQFNDRVLQEAMLKSNPALERLKFLSITASNLDEFFMVRLASLLRSISQEKQEENKQNLIRIETNILENVKKFTAKQERFLHAIQKDLLKKNIFIHFNSRKSSSEFQIGRKIFEEKIASQLIPHKKFQNTDLANLANLQMLVYFDQTLWVEVPKTIPSVFTHFHDDKKIHFFFLDDLLVAHLGKTLSTQKKPGLLRLTRDNDLSVDLSDEDMESIPDIIRTSLGGREKGKAVRLQYTGNLPERFLVSCQNILRLSRTQLFGYKYTFCIHALLGACSSVAEKISSNSGIINPPLNPMLPVPFSNKERAKIFDSLKKLDFMLHHPYDSFDAYINWIKTACEDPKVLSIEQTIYRIDALSPAIEALKNAAKNKKIKIVLELRARFDELNNLKLAEELRNAGVEVAFGFGKLKLHAKVTLVTRKEEDNEVLYTHLSTGNYNAKTARLYTDIALFTANQEIGSDARHFFNSIYSEKVPSTFKQLVIAPTRLQSKIRSLIHAETNAALQKKPAHIIAKVNALVDPNVIDDLYKASQAGVKVDLIVRGACSLVPGIKGISDNIRVISIVDRFLEHSRIYYFSNAETIYLSSADWMPRNFLSRLEIAFPILDKRLYQYISEIVLPGYLRDTEKARELSPHGTWNKIRETKSNKNHRAQFYFEELANQRYRETPLDNYKKLTS